MTRLAWTAPDPADEPETEDISSDAFTAWRRARSAGTYALMASSDALAPKLPKGWAVIAEPGPTPAVGDLVIIKFKTGQELVLEVLRRGPTWISACSPVGRRVSRQFPLSDIDAVDIVIAIVPARQLEAADAARR